MMMKMMRQRKMEVEVYSGCKYEKESVVINTVLYEDVIGLEVKRIEDDEVYGMGFDEVDEYKEYCILTFANGETATFRNSHVDVFAF